MITIKIPSYYQPFTGFDTEMQVNTATIGEAVNALMGKYPDLKPLIFTHWGILSANILIYLNDTEIFTLQGMDTPLKSGDRIILVPTISGG